MELLIKLTEVKKNLGIENDDFRFPFTFYKDFLDDEDLVETNSNGYKLVGTDTNCTSFIVEGVEFYYTTQGLNKKLCERLPITDFNAYDNASVFLKNIICSLKNLKVIGENYFETVADFIKLFYFTKISKGNQITSATFPIFPFCSFFSERATFHLPPFFENKQFGDYILSENIYHEAVHQSVNLALLTQEILHSDFDYKSSRKIKIPWRNKFWELDRVIHATFVYGHLIQFRLDALTRNSKLLFLNTLIDESLGCYKYLRNELMKSKTDFTEFGYRQLTEKLPPTSLAPL